MGDQNRLRDFLESLPCSINSMQTDTGFVLSGPGYYRTRSSHKECYVTYFARETDRMAETHNIVINIPSGTYVYTWYDPATGEYSAEENLVSLGTPVSLTRIFGCDVVLLVKLK